MKKSMFLISLGIIAITSCKKYDEGPSLSIRTKMNRITGEWEVKEFTVNNQDLVHFSGDDNLYCVDGFVVYYNESYDLTKGIYNFDKNGNWNNSMTYSTKSIDGITSYNYCDDFYDYSNETDVESGKWHFISDKEKIELTYSSDGTTEDWEIKKLKEKEMKLEYFDGADIYRITLEKR